VVDAFVQSHAQAAAYFKPMARRDKPGKLDMPDISEQAENWLADLPGLAAMRLHAAGVEQVEWCGQCTFSDPQQYFSYRRHAVTGRMATCAWRCQT